MTLTLIAGLLAAGLLASPLHVHDADSGQKCRLCQTERTAGPEDAGLRTTLPTLIDLGAPSTDEPVFEAIDARTTVRDRAPPARV